MRPARIAAPLLAIALAALAPAVSEARTVGTAAHAHPSLTKLHASPNSLPASGGKVTVTAHLKHARHCTLSASHHIPKLPHTVTCRKAGVTFHIALLANTSTSAVAYQLKLKATGWGSTTAHITVKVAAAKAKPPPGPTAVQVAAGAEETCAVLSNGKVYCWGLDDTGQIGNGSASETPVTKPAEVGGVQGATGISVGEDDACALLSTGHVDCWGSNGDGQVGNDNDEEAAVATATEVNGLEHAIEVHVGWDFACALIEGGTVDCWGENGHGEIGSGRVAKVNEYVLTPEAAKVEHVTKLDVYFKQACALISGGTLKCWGYDFFDQLGNAAEKVEAVETPVEDVYSKHVEDVSLGHNHGCVVEAGKVLCWGENHEAQLGDGVIGNFNEIQFLPAEAEGVSEAVEVGSGYSNSCARLENGHVDCWGINNEGAIGDGEGGFGKYPVDVPKEAVNLKETVQLSVGTQLVCAVVHSGHVYCWGSDNVGQAGDEQTGYERGLDEPTEVTGLP